MPADILVYDLAAIRHDVQERNQPFTRPAGEVYGHDPITRADLDIYHRRAAIQARVLGGGDDVAVEERVWVIAEVGHLRFGEVPTAAEMRNAVTHVVKGAVTLENVSTLIAKLKNESILHLMSL